MSGEEVKTNIFFSNHMSYSRYFYILSHLILINLCTSDQDRVWPQVSLQKSWFSMGAIFKIYVYIEKTNHYTYFKYELHVWNTTNQFTWGKVMLLVERFGDSYVKVIFSKRLHYLECSLAPPPPFLPFSDYFVTFYFNPSLTIALNWN